jgi:hypothetical protein
VLLTMLVSLLIATVFVRNLYCRFLCPLGAFLGILSKAHRLPHQALVGVQDLPASARRRASGGRFSGPQIIMTECVRCDDCERLYADTKKCPHHLIIIRKADILARRAASPVVTPLPDASA